MTKKKDPSLFKRNMKVALPTPGGVSAPQPESQPVPPSLTFEELLKENCVLIDASDPELPALDPAGDVPAEDPKASVLGLLGPKDYPKAVLINVSVQPQVRDFLHRMAKERGCSVSRIIRDALSLYLKTQ